MNGLQAPPHTGPREGGDTQLHPPAGSLEKHESLGFLEKTTRERQRADLLVTLSE